MKQVALSSFPYPILMVVGLFIFFFLFVGLLFWVNRKSARKTYDRIARMPLEEEEEKS